MTPQELNHTWSILQQIMDISRSKGADATEVIYARGNGLSLKAEKGAIAESKISGSQTCGIRITKGDRVATCYSESMDENALEQMVSQAMENTAYVKDDPLQKIQDLGQIELNNLSPKNFSQDDTSIEKKIELSLALEQKILDKGPEVKNAPYNGVSESEGHSFQANSFGLKAYSRSRSFSCYTSALIDSNGKQSMHYHSSIARKFSDLDPQSCIDKSYEVASGLLHGSPIPTGSYDVIFEHDTLAEFLSLFSIIFSARSAMEGKNPFKDKINTAIAPKFLNLSDIPNYADAYGESLFDSEGFLHRETSLIEEGVLKTFLHNSQTSRYFDTANTFHASRTSRGTLGVGSTYKVYGPGPIPEQQLFDGEVFYVIDLQGTSSGSDPISGDFSFGASGFILVNGQKQRAVKGVTLSGNFYQILKTLQLAGDKIHPDTSRSIFLPKIRFEKIKIAGT